MSNSRFQFRQFTIRQERCAMKVGTDGTLLGAWAHGGATILDIGTGTGLIALMMAQRFPDAHVVGIDIDHDAVVQATENVAASSFRNIDILEADIRAVEKLQTSNLKPQISNLKSQTSNLKSQTSNLKAIVCNPPYFVDSLECPDSQRTMARHTSSLSYRDLMSAAWRLLADDGELSVVIPDECKARLESEAALAGFSMSRECAVKTTPRKQPKRWLLASRKHPVTDIEREMGIIEDAPNVRSHWYGELTKDFYL